MYKQPKKRYQKLFATAHKYFVAASIGFTALTTVFIGISFYHHFKAKKALAANQNTVPKDIDTLTDSAPPESSQ